MHGGRICSSPASEKSSVTEEFGEETAFLKMDRTVVAQHFGRLSNGFHGVVPIIKPFRGTLTEKGGL